MDKNPNVINPFVIIMDYPNLHSPEYLESAFPSFCKALALMPIAAQARLVKVKLVTNNITRLEKKI